MNMQVEQLRTVAREYREKISSLETQLREQRDELRSIEDKIMGLTTVQPQKSAEVAIRETAMRSLVKAIGWRFTAGIVTFCTSFYFTRSLAAAAPKRFRWTAAEARATSTRETRAARRASP